MNIPLAPLSAAVTGLLAAAGIAALPTGALEALVLDSGVAALVPSAAPPLGGTARLLISGGVGLLAALFAGFGAFILFGTRAVAWKRMAGVRANGAGPVPFVRRADAHPDAPPRPPLRATSELGTPFLEVHARLRKGDEIENFAENDAEPLKLNAPVLVEVAAAEPDQTDRDASSPRVTQNELRRDFAPVRTPELMPEPMGPPASPPPPRVRPVPAEASLPQDLGHRLSSYDPGAIPDEPVEAPRRLAPLRRTPAKPVEQIASAATAAQPKAKAPETAAPAPVERDAPITRPETDSTIHALLDRLERGVERRGMRNRPAPRPRQPSEHGLEEALITLRNLARRA